MEYQFPKTFKGRTFKCKKLFCPACDGEVVVSYEVGHQPMCPACEGPLPSPDVPIKPNDGVVADSIPGGMVMDHLFPGHKVYSRTELNQAIAIYNKNKGTNWRISDYGWTGPNDRVFTKQGGTHADLRTKEERIAQMATFLGLTVDEYYTKFSRWLDMDSRSMP